MAVGIVKGGLNDGGGTDTSDATALASDILTGKTAYIATGKVTGTYAGGGGASLYLNEYVVHTKADAVLQIESDCYIKPAVALSDFVITGTSAITAVTYVDKNHVNFTMTPQPKDTSFTIKALASAFLHTNGDSSVLSITIAPLTVDKLIGRNDLLTLKGTGPSDSGTVTITSVVDIMYFNGGVSHTVTANGDTTVNVGSCSLLLNNRDNSYMYVYYQEGTLDTPACDFIKVVWEGYAPYSPYTEGNRFRFEFYWLANGDAFLKLVKASTTWNGAFSYIGQSYTINMTNPNLSFYAKGPLGMQHTQVAEVYDPTYTHDYEKTFTAMSSITSTTDNMEGFGYVNDDGSTSLPFKSLFTWRYNGSDRTYLTLSGNTWIGVGSATEDIKFGRADNKIHMIYDQFGRITLGGVTQKFWKIRWYGASPYGGTAGNHVFELVLFENGDAQLTSIAQAGSGTYSFLGVSYTISVGQSISFYRQNVEGTSWVQATELYDITKHVA